VTPIHLLGIVSSQARWLATRESVIASNVANSNTPGYKGMDVTPFSAVLDKTSVELATTSSKHIASDQNGPSTQRMRKGESWNVVHSGNSVSVEQELLKAGDVHRDYSLNTAISKSFHRMLLVSVKGS
jgi:flagellar basal-body rod protein FlgB